MTRRGFTLIEIMVSLMIFTIVSVAMLGIMLMASDIYRRGEAGRSANDEAVAVMAALDDDLSRIVPVTDGGWFYASLDANDDGTADPDGSTLIAFKVARRDRSQITRNGEGDRAIVAWWVKQEKVDNVEQNVLCRGELPALLDDPAADQDFNVLEQILDTGPHASVTTGCLHFGAYLAADLGGRDLAKEWLTDTTLNRITPVVNTTGQPQDFPIAIRITTVLTGGGRFAARGRLVKDIVPGDSKLRIVGLPNLSTQPGSMLKVRKEADPSNGEWIGYRTYIDGVIDFSGGGSGEPLVGRGRRRSTAAEWKAQDLVEVGQSYSLVRILR